MISTRVNLSEPVIKGVNLFAVVYLWLCTNNQLSDSNFEKKKKKKKKMEYKQIFECGMVCGGETQLRAFSSLDN